MDLLVILYGDERVKLKLILCPHSHVHRYSLTRMVQYSGIRCKSCFNIISQNVPGIPARSIKSMDINL